MFAFLGTSHLYHTVLSCKMVITVFLYLRVIVSLNLLIFSLGFQLEDSQMQRKTGTLDHRPTTTLFLFLSILLLKEMRLLCVSTFTEGYISIFSQDSLLHNFMHCTTVIITVRQWWCTNILLQQLLLVENWVPTLISSTADQNQLAHIALQIKSD